MNVNNLIKQIYNLWQNHKLIRISVYGILVLLLIYLAIPLPNPLFKPDDSLVILDENDHILRAYLNSQQQWQFPAGDSLNIPEKLKVAVLTFEDRHFYKHPGINPLALGRAIWQNMSEGRIVSGASTITMQLARIIQPKSRTVFHKLLEMLQAIKIETMYSKDEILTQYLNHAPYGGNIVGYQSAAYRYYGRPAHKLTWAQAAMLAVLPNAPGLISPARNPAQLREKRDRLLNKLFELGNFPAEDLQLAKLENIPQKLIRFPNLAPHLGDRVKSAVGDAAIQKTNLRREIQQQLNRLIRQHAQYLSEFGIRNCAAVVVDNHSGQVKAYAGSQDYFSQNSNGFVDGVRAPRSTGSTLKPFLYALAMDEGIILPQSKMMDIPSYFGSFSPANASKTHSGLVSAQDALIQSLNVPAVRLLYTYGLFDFYLFLQDMELSTLFRSADDYGLPLILGGAESSLWDLVQLYHGLANGGNFSKIYISEKDKPSTQKKMFSSGGAYLTLDMLRNLKRPGAEFYWEQYREQWPLAWKTGTSYGHRDAWAIGTNPRWTIGVWVGNFDGASNLQISGAKAAAPLLFDIFNGLPKDAEQRWFEKPVAQLKVIKICRDSGFPANEYCPDVMEAEAPLQQKTMKNCPWHRKIYVSANRKHEVCSLCWESGKYETQVRNIYPAPLSQFLREQGHFYEKPLPHRPDCPSVRGGDLLSITYPTAGARIWLPRDVDGKYQKVNLRAAHGQAGQTIYWYLNGQYAGTTSDEHQLAMQLNKGWHDLLIIDQQGNRAKRRFYVMHR